jgi:hypothetical protein
MRTEAFESGRDFLDPLAASVWVVQRRSHGGKVLRCEGGHAVEVFKVASYFRVRHFSQLVVWVADRFRTGAVKF